MNKDFSKKTKIIASIGPASWSKETIIGLYHAGVNVLRINFSHADHEKVTSIVKIVEELNQTGSTKLALLGDLKGPEIRLGSYEGIKKYKKGDCFRIAVDSTFLKSQQDQFCDYPGLIDDIALGGRIRIESGIFDVIVKKKGTHYLEVEALNDAQLSQRRHVNLPGTKIKLPGLSKQDKQDVDFCIKHGFDFIAMSFVRNKKHIQELRKILGKDSAIDIIAKLENQEGLDHLDEIIQESDGVMVARGDLGIEIDIASLPLRQKKIVDRCKELGKPAIVATQLIESMITTPFPTRAEVSDIFNAVMQKADALMTSGETAIGQYPITTVETMSRVIAGAEEQINYHHHDFTNQEFSFEDNKKKSLVRAALEVATSLEINHILLFTRSGRLAKIAAALRPKPTIYAFTENRQTFTKLALYFGIKSRFKNFDFYHDGMKKALKSLIKSGDIQTHDKVIALFETKRGKGYHFSLEVIDVSSFF